MALRYCPQCDQWYSTSEYTVNDSGETVCKKDGHNAVHGYIDGSMDTVADFKRDTYLSNPEDEIEAAVRQGILRRE